MSAYLYLVCADHDPPLESEEEVGQHLADLPTIRAVLAARHRHTMHIAFVDPHAETARRFLNAHPKCRVVIRDENGVEHPTTDPKETL